MNVRERLGDNRPYWKVLVSLVFSVIGTALFIYIGMRAVFFFMPFVIGWFLAFIASPLVKFLEKHFKILAKLSSAIVIIFVLGVCIGVLYLIISKLVVEVVRLVQDFPIIYKEIETGFVEIADKLDQVSHLLPESVRTAFATMMQDMDEKAGDLISKISEPTVIAAGNIAKKIPSIFVATIVTIISAYFFVADREGILEYSKKITPKPIVDRMSMVMYNLKYAVGGYFRAQFKIMLVVWIILMIGFSVMGIHFSVLLALGIAFLDLLPFFGTGTALIPWAVYQFLVTDYKMMAGLLVVYAITQLVRQIIQPKLVGDSIGLNPVVTLVLLYVGYKVGSVLGMIFAVPIGMILVNLYKAGAFDYILDDVKILMEGILSLRKS